MPRILALFLMAAAPLAAGIWPEWFDGWKRVSAAPIALTDQAIWDEYGLETTEQASYEKAGAKFTAFGGMLSGTKTNGRIELARANIPAHES